MKDRLIIKPFIVAATMLVAGLILIVLGFARSGNANMNNYALATFGLLLVIAGAITSVMYGALERRYRRLLRERPLLHYTLKAEAHQAQIKKNIDELLQLIG